MSAAHPALDSESAQLHAWLRASERPGAVVNVADVARVKARLVAIEDAKRRDKQQAKRAKRLWGTVLETVGQHNPTAAGHLRKLAASPDDKAALAGVVGALAAASGKSPVLAQALQVGLPIVQQLFVNDDDTTEE